MHLESADHVAGDVCRILSMGLLADGDLDDPEVLAIAGLRIEETLGIPAARFRAVLHEVCEELIRDDPQGRGISLLDPSDVSAALRMLNEPEHRFDSSARLIDLMQAGDPLQLESKLRDPSRIDAALDRVVDPALRYWTCAGLLHVMSADGEWHSNEMAIFKHVLERWQIAPETLRAALLRAAC